MSRLSVDYAGLVRGLRIPLAPAALGTALLDAAAERYEHQFPDCSLLQFVQSGATYLFDLASAVGAEQEDRTLAAWTITPATVGKRDVSYQRGFPLPPDPDGMLVDRGHLIPHLSGGEFGPTGGEFGPNIFRQRRHLNDRGAAYPAVSELRGVPVRWRQSQSRRAASQSGRATADAVPSMRQAVRTGSRQCR
jgi:hypothetical protein